MSPTKPRCIAVFKSILGAPDNATLDQRLAFSVENSGNIVFQEAVIRQIVSDKVISYWEDLHEGVDTLILTMANFIRPDVGDLERFVDHLDQCKIERIILIGVGAQSYHYDAALPIAKAALRLLNIVSERSKSIGVRGYYTAELLKSKGITNVDVIGCPSMFMGINPDFNISGCCDDALANDGMGFSVNATPAGFFRDKIADLFRYARRHDADYILQNERHLLPLLKNSDQCSSKEKDSLDFFVNYYSSDPSEAAELKHWLSKRAKIFFELDDWMAYNKTRRFFMGGRIHGNILAVLSGVPALTLVFDSRTRELCEYLKLPSMPFEDFDPNYPLQQYVEFADFGSFNSAFPSRYKKYVEFLNANELPHRLPMVDVGTTQRGGADFSGALLAAMTLSDRVKLQSVSDYISSLISRDMREAEIVGLIARLRAERSEAKRLDAEASSPANFFKDPPSL
jgi:hypothetical protein